MSALVAGVLVTAMTLGLAGPAHAGQEFIDHWSNGKVIVYDGHIRVVDDVTEWSLHLRPSVGLRDGQCAYLHLQIDRNLGEDPVRHSGTICGPNAGTVNFDGGPERHSRVRGVRLLVVGPIETQQVTYVRE